MIKSSIEYNRWRILHDDQDLFTLLRLGMIVGHHLSRHFSP
jgi:hypothetical protein